MTGVHIILMFETFLILFFTANSIESSSILHTSIINPTLPTDVKGRSKVRKLVDIPSCATWSKNGTIVAGSKNDTPGNDSIALDRPGSLDFDSYNNLYIVDFGNNRVMQWKNGAIRGLQIGGFIYRPQFVFVSSTGNIYLTDSKPGQNDFDEMYQYDSITNSWRTIIRKLPRSSMDFYVHEDQSLIYVVSYGENIVMSYNLDGTSKGVVAGIESESESENDSYHLSDPSGVFINEHNGYMYVADSVNNRIQRYEIGKKKGVTVAGVDVGCELNIPVQVIVTYNGDIYTLELFKNRIMKVTNNYTPKCSCIFGCSDSYNIDSFQFDKYGNLYIVDHNKHTVLKFDISFDKCSLKSESPLQVQQNYMNLMAGVIIVFLTVMTVVMITMNWSANQFKELKFNKNLQNNGNDNHDVLINSNKVIF